MHKILVVDDEPAIRGMLVEFLTSIDYAAVAASDGEEALAVLSQQPVDLVLSDINMPRMKGFELLKIVREKYPHIKRALITAYNVEDYLELALAHDVGNIIPKTAPFNFLDVEIVVHKLLTEDIFGLEKYIEKGIPIVRKKAYTADEIDTLAAEIVEASGRESMAGKLKLVLIEILTNAIFYGARKADSEKKENWDRNFRLSEAEAIEVSWAKDREKFVAAIADPFGRLKKNDVLHWLCRQTKKDESGLPIGIFDLHGRGLFISREYADSLVINIKANVRTEVILSMYYEQQFEGFKPLYINEI